MSERSGGRERSEQSGASERVGGASERVNRRANGPVLTSVFFSIFDHSVLQISRFQCFPLFSMRGSKTVITVPVSSSCLLWISYLYNVIYAPSMILSWTYLIFKLENCFIYVKNKIFFNLPVNGIKGGDLHEKG